MSSFRPFLLIAALTLTFSASQPASAHGPADLFDECTRNIAQLTKRCKNATVEEAEECIPLIKRLLNDGQTQRARDVAARCINRINLIQRKCQEELKDRCERCADALVQMGAPDLAREILARCRRASNRMKETRDRAVEAIRGLF